MDIWEIVKDSLKYPLSNWKSYLILGIIVVFANLYVDIRVFSQNNELIMILWIMGAIIGIFTYGYMFKIIRSSLDNVNVLPEFNGLVKIFTNGFKALIVGIIYLIPVFLLGLGGLFFGLIRIQAHYPYYMVPGILFWIIALYAIVIIPVIAVAITNMAHNESKLRSAFRFREILEKISAIGWGNLIKWYMVIGILYWIIGAIILVIYYLLSWINPFFAGIIESLILVPYRYIFAARSVGLIYMHDNED